MVLLDRDEDDVLAAIESGVLTWAWDIRREGAERREIRVWRDSLLDVLLGTRKSADEGDVAALLLPERPIRTTELQRLWSCSSSHVTHLLVDGTLKAEAPRETGSGPNAFARISPAVVRSFLRGRRLT